MTKPSDDRAITSTQFARKEHKAVEVGGPAATDADATDKSEEDQQKIKVRALRTFHEDAGMKGKLLQPGDEFECNKLRAAELRANGLIEYANEHDDKAIHGEVDSKKIAERVERQQKAGELPEHHKTTPLRNPELKLGEVDDSATDKSGKPAKK